MPARNSSLFLTGRVSLAARCLSSSNTRYSAFGMVKLSRISLVFLAFVGAAGFSGFEGASALERGNLTATFSVKVFFTAVFLTTAFLTAAFVAGSLSTGILAGAAGAWLVAGAGDGTDWLIVLEVVMTLFFLVKRYK